MILRASKKLSILNHYDIVTKNELMPSIFDTFSIGGMTLPNRCMRSATWVGLATTDGHSTPAECEVMADLARGGVGLVASGHMAVEACGRARNRQLMIYDDGFVSGLQKLTQAVHAHGAKIMAQISHTGNYGNEAISGEVPRVVSLVPELMETPRRVLTEDEIVMEEELFVKAALRAAEAGFDAVQLHCAHGYLFNQFLSPIFNKRTDKYGGGIENRVRALTETIVKVKRALGDSLPLLIKINAADFNPGGLVIEDTIAAVKLCQQAGLDGVELSGGLSCFGQEINLKTGPSRGGINKPEKEAYFRPEAQALRARCDLPLILVGGMRSFAVADEIVRDGIADMFALSRPLIRDPFLVKRWHDNNYVTSDCLSCNDCFQPGYQGLGVYCTKKDRNVTYAR